MVNTDLGIVLTLLTREQSLSCTAEMGPGQKARLLQAGSPTPQVSANSQAEWVLDLLQSAADMTRIFFFSCKPPRIAEESKVRAKHPEEPGWERQRPGRAPGQPGSCSRWPARCCAPSCRSSRAGSCSHNMYFVHLLINFI